jgi:hypothetical protein
MELNGTEYKYALAMNVTGLQANVVLQAYKIEEGEKVFYPDSNFQILALDVSQSPDEDVLQVAGGINALIQEFITKKGL